VMRCAYRVLCVQHRVDITRKSNSFCLWQSLAMLNWMIGVRRCIIDCIGGGV